MATLSERLETRKLVERVKGLLQTKHGMTGADAFADGQSCWKPSEHPADKMPISYPKWAICVRSRNSARDDHRRAVPEQALVGGDADLASATCRPVA